MRRAVDSSVGPSYDNNHIQEENEQMTRELQTKVSALKSLSIDMGAEVREQNKAINDMGDFFTKSQGILQSSMKRLAKIATGGQNKHLLWLFFFCLFIFLVIYFIIRSR
ncbi:BET1 homolog [Anneissia japonica]|uniref:BET1 homolog n=1 Tax=Anneissia japonica TaxID=1529436 RepID=UPI00142559E2|nr:BET1 homolog [Anneissia japonica]